MKSVCSRTPVVVLIATLTFAQRAARADDPIAVCCHGTVCTIVAEPECESDGGNWLGDRVPPVIVSCGPGICDLGACCLGIGVCDNSPAADTQAECTGLGGTFHNGLDCSNPICGSQSEEIGTAITYQGEVTRNGAPIGSPSPETCDFQFQLSDHVSGGLIFATDTKFGVTVTNGLVTIPDVDFGAQFKGLGRYIEVSIKCPPDVAYTTLSPRVRVAPAPYALALPGVHTTQKGPTNTPNIIAGWFGNGTGASVVGATISGGGGDGLAGADANAVFANYGTVGGGRGNKVGASSQQPGDAHASAVVGGADNRVTGSYSFVGGGLNNIVLLGDYGVIGGGTSNTVDEFASFSAILGGSGNSAQGYASSVGGGTQNYSIGSYAAVCGGFQNGASGYASAVAGGLGNKAGGNFSFGAGRRAKVRDSLATGDSDGDEGTFMWADSTDADFVSTGPNQFNIRATGGLRLSAASGTTPTLQSIVPVGGGSQDLAINPSGGSVGIGTSGPQRLLHVGDTSVSDSEGMIRLESRSGTGAGTRAWDVGVPETDQVFTGTGYSFVIDDVGTVGTTELMIKYGTGNVGVGRIPATNRLEIEGDASKTTAGSWLANSDAAIKTEVRSLDHALDVIDRLHPVAFRYADDYRAKHPQVGEKDYYNYIAQEFREVFPGSVQDSGEDGLLQMDSYPAGVYSVAAIQELHAMVKDRDCEIENLKSEIETMKEMIAKLAVQTQRGGQ